jgi:hypothetical protein
MAKAEITAKQVVELLRKKHPQPEWCFFDELRCGSGYSKAAQKRIDAWALNCYPSKKHLTISYEVKVYRSDFLNEMKDPKKRKQGLNLSNQFYFVAPTGVIKLEEVPDECGYIEVIANKLKIIKEAPLRTCKEPTWLFVSSIARRTAKNEGVDFLHFTDVVIGALINALRSIKPLNGSETLLHGYLEKEMLKRVNVTYNKLKAAKKKARLDKKKFM